MADGDAVGDEVAGGVGGFECAAVEFGWEGVEAGCDA